MTRRALLLLLSASALGGCLFAPKLEENGYAKCASDDECEAGRACYSGLCTPPPWHDDGFVRRQLLVVDNGASSEPLADGAAIAVRFGGEDGLPTSAIGVDGRLTRYSFATGSWSDVPVWRDIYDDYLLMYVPTGGEVAAGDDAPLAWIESQTGGRDPSLVEDAAAVFPLLFHQIGGSALDDTRWATFGTGTPVVADGAVTVLDNQKLVLRAPLAPPFSLTFKGRINGVACDQTYFGLVADDGVGFEVPSVGFFVQQDLATILEVAPGPDSTPQAAPGSETVALDNTLRRFRIDVAEQQVRWAIDDEIVGEPAGVRFLGEELFFTIDVDGDCSFALELIHATPLPFAHPTVRAEEVVEYEIFE